MGISWISRKGVDLEKGGGYEPPYQLCINSSFDCDPTQDVRGVFLDVSKAFDKVWHDGLLYI